MFICYVNPGRPLKTVVFVRVYHQRFQGTILFHCLWLLGLYNVELCMQSYHSTKTYWPGRVKCIKVSTAFRISLSRKSVEPAGWSRASLRFLTACLLSLGQQILQPQKTRGCEFPWYHACAVAFVLLFFFSNGLCGTFPSSGSCWFHGQAALWLLKRLGPGWGDPINASTWDIWSWKVQHPLDRGGDVLFLPLRLIMEPFTSFVSWGISGGKGILGRIEKEVLTSQSKDDINRNQIWNQSLPWHAKHIDARHVSL